jgi:hypothetical protein
MIMAVFVSNYLPHVRENIPPFFELLDDFTYDDVLQFHAFTYLPVNNKISFFFMAK